MENSRETGRKTERETGKDKKERSKFSACLSRKAVVEYENNTGIIPQQVPFERKNGKCRSRTKKNIRKSPYRPWGCREEPSMLLCVPVWAPSICLWRSVTTSGRSAAWDIRGSMRSRPYWKTLRKTALSPYWKPASGRIRKRSILCRMISWTDPRRICMFPRVSARLSAWRASPPSGKSCPFPPWIFFI